MTCQEAIDLMGDAIDGRLPPSAGPGFQEHMTECSSCGTYFGQLRLTRQALGSASRPAVSSPHRDELLARFREEFGAGK
jgi:anti-sigma factor RsiW